MPIPEFYHFIKPALEIYKDGQSLSIKQIEGLLADKFSITPEERAELLPSARSTRLYSRVQWALTYLRQAKLLQSVGRGINKITPRGVHFLQTSPDVIKPSDLTVFPEFVTFQQGKISTISASDGPATAKIAAATADEFTPEESIEDSYQTLKDALAQELLERVKSMPPIFFEQLIVQLMLSLGYGGTIADAGQTLGKSGDGGVDGVIKQDKLGLDKIYLQAKRWNEGTVGSKDVQAFVGALSGQGASKGVFITTSTFSKAAQDYTKLNHAFKVSLVNGIELAHLMIDHNLGVSLVQRYDVKRIDSDFFSES
jgi:restriction system protein